MTPNGVLSGLVWAAVIVGLWFIGGVVARRRPTYAADRPDVAYMAFTSDYDLVIPSADIPARLAEDGVEGEVPRDSDQAELPERQKAFELATAAAAERLAAFDGRLTRQSICFLLDMSGSMVARMPRILGELRALHRWVTDHDARCAVLGFTTRGWRGGLSREKWAAEGRAPYPGRLCALMHVVIADFGENPSPDSWAAVLRPDALRENVDGEAIRWAGAWLGRERTEKRRLIVLSDGAPVDDSTLSENGSSYLWTDLNHAIREIESAGDLELVGIGLSHHVERLYTRSGYLADGSELSTLAMPIILDRHETERVAGERD